MPQAEVDVLFAAVAPSPRTGTSTLFVSHRLDEVFAVADRVTVVRDGRRVAVTDIRDLDHHDADRTDPRPAGRLTHVDVAHRRHAPTAPTLSVRHLQGRHLRTLDLDVHAGEILGSPA